MHTKHYTFLPVKLKTELQMKKTCLHCLHMPKAKKVCIQPFHHLCIPVMFMVIFFGGHKEKGITHLNADYYVHILWDFNLAH